MESTPDMRLTSDLVCRETPAMGHQRMLGLLLPREACRYLNFSSAANNSCIETPSFKLQDSKAM